MNAPDPVLAAERTQLAWQRFAFALAVVGVLAFRAGVHADTPIFGFALAAVMGTAATSLQLAGPRLRAETATTFALAASSIAAIGAAVVTVVG